MIRHIGTLKNIRIWNFPGGNQIHKAMPYSLIPVREISLKINIQEIIKVEPKIVYIVLDRLREELRLSSHDYGKGMTERERNCYDAGQNIISLTAPDRETVGSQTAYERFVAHQKWAREVLEMVSAKSGVPMVYGFFYNYSEQTSLFGKEDPQFVVADGRPLRPLIIGRGLECDAVEIVPGPDFVLSESWDWNEDDGSRTEYDADTRLFYRESVSGRHQYLIYITKNKKCILVPEEYWGEPERFTVPIQEDEDETMQLIAARNAAVSSRPVAYDGCDADPAEVIIVEGSEEVRRQVNGVWQHKHPGYSYWHPMKRVHKEMKY